MNNSSQSGTAGPKYQRHLLSNRFAYPQHRLLEKYTTSQRTMLEQLQQRLNRGIYRMVAEPCPCGQSAENLTIAEVDRYGLPLNNVLCLACETVRIDPYLDSASLESFYREMYQDLYGRAVKPEEYFARQQQYGEKIRRALFGAEPGEGRAVLEIGCGAGGALARFREAGFRAIGCDFSTPLLEFGSQHSAGELICGGVAEVRRQLPDVRFDAIFLHHVFEHVRDPASLLAEVRSLATDRSRVLIVVPDLSRIDRFSNPAGNALDFFHVAHKYNYSPRGIFAIAARAGMCGRLRQPDKTATAWSQSPELWVELQLGQAATAQQFDVPTGGPLLAYLQRTERHFQRGLCRAQIATRLRHLRPDRLVKAWIRSQRKAA